MYTSDNDKLFLSQLDDAVYLCQKRQKPYFFSFMSERKQAIAAKHLDMLSFSQYAFDGGYPDSERRVLGLWYDEPIEAFPVCGLTLSLSLGIERETVGDILVEDGRCIVFVKAEIKEYITSQLFKIGNCGVKISDLSSDDLPKGRGFEETVYTVASLRLDSIVAAISGLSREKAKNLVLSGAVAVNHLGCDNLSKHIGEGDVLTVRGKGKFKINGVLGETKKHRIRVSIIHYR